MTRLHVLLGAGGVGKTTLAAGYALALAREGHRVGLLGIDPSRRLHDALGLTLGDREAPVPGAPTLSAAILHPHQALRRWAGEDCASAAEVEALERNPFFLALSDRLASASDALAAVRAAEWAERDRSLDDLVVDTAPGLSAVGFVRYPRDIDALLSGRLIEWLKLAADAGGARTLRFGARRLLGAFTRLAGGSMVTRLAEFFVLAAAPLRHMVTRLKDAQRWFRSREAELLLVTSPNDFAAGGAAQLAQALAALSVSPRAVIVNRTWPREVVDELRGLDEPDPLLRHAAAYARAQLATERAAARLAPVALSVPVAPALFVQERREALVELGRSVRSQLAGRYAPAGPVQPSSGGGVVFDPTSSHVPPVEEAS